MSHGPVPLTIVPLPMPCSYAIDTDLGLAIVQLVGHVTGDELVDVYRRHLGDPAWHPAFRLLWDLRAIDLVDLDPASAVSLRDAIAETRDLVGPGRTAILAYGATRERAAISARSFGLLAGRNPAREETAVASLKDAAEWLDVPAEDLRRAVLEVP